MNDTVHVKVKVVKLRNLVLLDELTDERVPLRHEAEELGDTHGCGRNVGSLRETGVKECVLVGRATERAQVMRQRRHQPVVVETLS